MPDGTSTTHPYPRSTNTSPDSSFDVSKVAGNVPLAVKHRLGNLKAYFDSWIDPRFFKDPSYVFGRSVVDNFRVTEVSVYKTVNEESKLEGKVIIELEVTREMINGAGNIHGGCSAFLVDICSSLAVSALTLATEGKEYLTVSQAINMIYHSPADLGDTIRLVNTSVTVGGRTHTCRTEIWNATHRRLVASGTHVKMKPSLAPKANL
ncbi:hypothetical protein EST38_g2738 [Candolleomyces aberdarensis]|uniref:Thioesterase domain-containing protein n=1 Tax=Candolleomyces aberdarensis TaxID=2316362 RepID=A0A4Q2DS91_9AGAR|nr:hypothetical protein EST38_g2738 [Candolleomyces aberdarensis]